MAANFDNDFAAHQTNYPAEHNNCGKWRKTQHDSNCDVQYCCKPSKYAPASRTIWCQGVNGRLGTHVNISDSTRPSAACIRKPMIAPTVAAMLV